VGVPLAVGLDSRSGLLSGEDDADEESWGDEGDVQLVGLGSEHSLPRFELSRNASTVGGGWPPLGEGGRGGTHSLPRFELSRNASTVGGGWPPLGEGGRGGTHRHSLPRFELSD
jgi:hypothetical protein